MAEEGTASTNSAPVPAPSGGVVQQCIDFKDGFRMTGGDWGSLTQVCVLCAMNLVVASVCIR